MLVPPFLSVFIFLCKWEEWLIHLGDDLDSPQIYSGISICHQFNGCINSLFMDDIITLGVSIKDGSGESIPFNKAYRISLNSRRTSNCSCIHKATASCTKVSIIIATLTVLASLQASLVSNKLPLHCSLDHQKHLPRLYSLH